MSRQHAAPILVPLTGTAAPLTPAEPDWAEATIQALVQAHPECLPIREIDPLFADPVPLCTEMNSGSGYIDNVMVTPTGLPVLVECKLWRNPQARREVIGQILDYAKALSRWTASDMQREVSSRTGHTVIELLAKAGHAVDEIAFTDALTLNLRRGRFLLLIVGDGIREGVEAIAEYLQGQGGLHFTLGLVEMPIYTLPDGGRLVAPRVLARTANVTRTVVAAPEGMTVLDDAEDDEGEALSPDVAARRQKDRARHRDDRIAFWTEFLTGLRLDDPEQAIPRPTGQGFVTFSLPVPDKSLWLNVYRNANEGLVGISLKGSPQSLGQRILERFTGDDLASLREALGGKLLTWEERGMTMLYDRERFGDFADPAVRAEAFTWLRSRVNAFVSTIRPRVRDALEDLTRA